MSESDSSSEESFSGILDVSGDDTDQDVEPPDHESNTMQYKGVTVSVLAGALEKQQVDVIVNSTSDKLQLKSGRGSRALLTEAGDDLQKECTKKYPSGIARGDVAVTGPGKLSCKLVCHGCLLKYGQPDAEKVHIQFISKCLEEASRQNMLSIAFPGLTTGFLKFPKGIASKNTFKTIAQFLDNNPQTSIKSIKIVIHSGDGNTLSAFKESLRSWNQDEDIEKKEICKCQISNVTLTVKTDVMQDQQVDVIVNSVGKKFDLNKGTLSKDIVKSAGQVVVDECKRDYPNGIAEGDVLVTNAGNLPCKKIYHVCVPPYKESNHNESKQNIQDITRKCLDLADQNKLSSIAFPVLGTSYCHYPVKMSAQATIAAIEDFMNTNQNPSIKEIIVVIWGARHADKIKAYENETAKYDGATCGPDRKTPEFCLQMYHKEVRPPTYWTVFTSNKSVKLWKTEAGDSYHRLVDVDDATKKAVEDLVSSTWQAQKIGHGRDAVGLGKLNYSAVKVKKVRRLENIDLFENYAHFRARLFHKAGDIGVFDQLGDLPNSKGQILTTDNLPSDSVLNTELYPEINEHFLFHGTKPDTYKKILSQGLDFRMAGEKGMFGQGMYLAESSTKADQYTDPKTDRNKEEKHMFLVRSCLGKIHLEGKPSNKLHRPPCFVDDCISDSCEHSELQRCDSVIGDGTWIFREFVTYAQNQNYPEYLITYVRE